MLFAQLAQWARGAFALIVLVSYGMQYRLLQRLQLGQSISNDAADANDARVQLLTDIQLVIAILAFVALALWFYRAYQNVHRLPNAKPEYSPNMAALSWFIPFVNLWIPYKIMLEIGHYLGGFTNPRITIISSRWDYLAVGWWILNIGVFIVSRFNLALLKYSSDNISIEELLRSSRLLMASQVVTMLCALATIAVLKAIAPHESALVTSQDETSRPVIV